VFGLFSDLAGIALGYHEQSFVLISIRFIQDPLLALLVPAIHKEL